ncbi:MAG: NAD(P)H-dependent oxidoreductase [Verrucomicrobiae bacterium]|nr:NAD(P)H-dependent oxidoreductase [Verrucomicrobiae bacterium]
MGSVAELSKTELQSLEVGGRKIALSFRDGRFGAVSACCLHVGGPLGDGCVRDDYVVCPWHGWMFHRVTGEARPGIPAAVPRYELKVESGDLFIDLASATPAKHAPHPPHPLARDIVRKPGRIRVAGISTTVMDATLPRYSTSLALLEEALAHASSKLNAETQIIRLDQLKFRACEGYYSKNERACTWPCSITQMDASDELDRVYEAMVFWADVVLVATPIRWGNASSLYYKMAERMNCIQNQITLADKVLIRDKVASFIITGGQDNVQAVAGQMMMFFSELGFLFPQFPFVAHTRGWAAEDMENNIRSVRHGEALKAEVRALAERCVRMAEKLVLAGSTLDAPVS